jgi:NAD(P) transhydrogenase subunit alpha
VVTTALVPGRKAPVLITGAMVRDMRRGAVIVDMAAETGGNCELTQSGTTVVEHGVTIMGPVNLPATMPQHASQMYSRNISALFNLLAKKGELAIDFDDEIVKGCCITHGGRRLLDATGRPIAGGERAPAPAPAGKVGV